ncbi:hypothetical protein BY996DRAFT_6589692 [Phakopsora pachyrhizi]|nr:hypothetical protein BY996DRAFT_6589692 [Phakopsora pachyrhizi]
MSTMNVGVGFCSAGPGVGRAGRGLAQLGLVRKLGQVGQLRLAWFQLGQVGKACFGLVSAGAGRAAQFGLVSAGAGRAAQAARFQLVARAAWFQLGFSWGRAAGFGLAGAGKGQAWFQLGWGRAGLAQLGQVGQGQVVGQAQFLGFGLAGAGRAGLAEAGPGLNLRIDLDDHWFQSEYLDQSQRRNRDSDKGKRHINFHSSINNSFSKPDDRLIDLDMVGRRDSLGSSWRGKDDEQVRSNQGDGRDDREQTFEERAGRTRESRGTDDKDRMMIRFCDEHETDTIVDHGWNLDREAFDLTLQRGADPSSPPKLFHSLSSRIFLAVQFEDQDPEQVFNILWPVPDCFTKLADGDEGLSVTGMGYFEDFGSGAPEKPGEVKIYSSSLQSPGLKPLPVSQSVNLLLKSLGGMFLWLFVWLSEDEKDSSLLHFHLIQSVSV